MATQSIFTQRWNAFSSKRPVDHPWWTVKNATPLDSGGNPLFLEENMPLQGASESKLVQPYWTNLIAKLAKNLPVALHDTHNQVSFGEIKAGIHSKEITN